MRALTAQRQLISACHQVVSLTFVSCDESTIDRIITADLVPDSRTFFNARLYAKNFYIEAICNDARGNSRAFPVFMA